MKAMMKLNSKIDLQFKREKKLFRMKFFCDWEEEMDDDDDVVIRRIYYIVK